MITLGELLLANAGALEVERDQRIRWRALARAVQAEVDRRQREDERLVYYEGEWGPRSRIPKVCR